ncbi:CoA transferase subunit A [Rhodococcus sp. D2-41]|uniref:Acyl CoA--acetate/3-ketoacid CoA transferase subunit alpha n=1 Tax=Speluncibacter jeojiensis TaxID=2710754 RepID=A0A9X4M6R9_9ACTN|nr:CoA-transferase [Rhodococcus sp. D2-41]MDG3008970.1 CoA transferase subunit A [Rhodococcus sp. D2-41]MDG3015481.1 acyl CoA--acetate/3-ketoacid CoA transferase subunit alpha [Corynebacteriales bacterium D3-21]
MSDKTMSEADVIGRLRSGMTIGIGGWGSRRKPMSLIREILRSDLKDLTIVSYGGADVGLLCAAGKVKKVIFGFVSLDSIPLDPHFRAARQSGSIEVEEYDEGMLQWGLYAAGIRLPYLPTRAGLGSDVMTVNPGLRTVTDPYGDETLVAMPAIRLDAALVHMNRADMHGNAQYLGPDLYFDDLFCLAADNAYVSCEKIVPTAELTANAHPSTVRIPRLLVSGVVESSGGAHFTSCVPDYDRDEAFQRDYVAAAKDPDRWKQFAAHYLSGTEGDYQRAVEASREAVSA